jgi:hypothetical protein
LCFTELCFRNPPNNPIALLVAGSQIQQFIVLKASELGQRARWQKLADASEELPPRVGILRSTRRGLLGG